jgi:DNA polymerase-3 subunit gamma/tau
MIEPPEDAFDPGPGGFMPPPVPAASVPVRAPGSSDADGAPSAAARPGAAGPRAQVKQESAPARQAPPEAQAQAPAPAPAQALAGQEPRRESTPQPDPSAQPGKPISRYQRLLDEAARKRAEAAAADKGTVDLRYVEDVPSADDETIEETGLVGRPAIERILNGRLVEERRIDAQ